MKQITFLIIAMLTLNLAQAQKKEKLEEFTASNGITYKIGDEIKLGRGSDTNGKFVYVNIGGWAISTNPEENRLGAANAGLLVTIKKINKYNYKRYKGVYFTVGGGNITNYNLDIENAIKTCEVENCTEEVQKVEVVGNMSDKYDQLKKLKKLLDEGVLTQAEYDAEKKKILEQDE
jgi:hypothetical protein